MRGIYEAAQENIKRIERFQQISEQDKGMIKSFKATTKSTWMVYAYFRNRLISEIKTVSEQLGMSFNTVAKSVNNLLEMGILQLESGQFCHILFIYKRLVDALNEEV